MVVFSFLLTAELRPPVADIRQEESAFAKGEASRLCIPPVAVYCQARRSDNRKHFVSNLYGLNPERQTLYDWVRIPRFIQAQGLDDIQCYALMIYRLRRMIYRPVAWWYPSHRLDDIQPQRGWLRQNRCKQCFTKLKFTLFSFKNTLHLQSKNEI